MKQFIIAAAILSAAAFAAGVWTQASLAERHRPEIITSSTPSTISPLEMHGKVKPGDLPVQYMQGDFN